MIGIKKSDGFTRYSSHITRGARWKTLRAAILERDGYRCKSCGARGRLEVDHIQPVRLAPALAYAPENLQALCPACHTKKTRIEAGHKPARETCPKWQAAIEALSRPGKTKPKSRKDIPCSIQ